MKNFTKNQLMAILWIAGSAVLGSCASTVTVYRDQEVKKKEEGKSEITTTVAEKVKGIPFYTQKGIIRQETQYLHSWYEVSFVKVETKDKPVETVLITRRVKKGTSMAEVENLVNKLPDQNDATSKKTVEQIISTISTLDGDITPPKDIKHISNNWKNDFIVDYETRYYLNTKMPWFGTSTVSQKLAANGTLTEASATTDSQLDELATAVAGLATPFASIKVAEIEKAAIPTESMVKSLNNPNLVLAAWQAGLTYKLVIMEKGYLYKFSKIICEGPCNESTNKLVALPFDLETGNYIRSSWPSSGSESKPAEDKPTINVSGSIQLPKE